MRCGNAIPSLADAHGGLTPALEVWAYVQSRPEAEKLIAGLGKRDVSYDDQPLALTWFRPASAMLRPEALSAGSSRHAAERSALPREHTGDARRSRSAT